MLKALYVKIPNKSFAKHLLATAKQELGHLFDDFLLMLTKLSKVCSFNYMSCEEYCKEMI